MSKIRVGFSSDWNIKGNNVGFGTTNPSASLQVVEDFKTDFNITGVATLTAYGGFVAQRQYVSEPSKIEFTTVGLGTFKQPYQSETKYTDLGGVHHGDDQKFNTLSEDLVIDDGQILNVSDIDMVGFTTIGEYDSHSHSSYVCAGSLEQVSVTGHFSVPTGGSNDRQQTPVEGTVRFNTDIGTLEFFNGNEWRQFVVSGGSGRSLFAGGRGNPGGGNIDYTHVKSMQVNTLGSVTGFGDLTLNQRYGGAGCSNSIRGLVCGGWQSPVNNFDVEYFTLASEGNGIDWGQNNAGGWGSQGASSSVRGMSAGGGYPTATATIDSFHFATAGSKEDFGDIAGAARGRGDRAANNQIRAVFGGGYTPAKYNIAQSKNLSSDGNTVAFGEFNRGNGRNGAVSDSVRGVFSGAWNDTSSPAGTVGCIDFFTFATFGDAVEFGDLSVPNYALGNCQNMTRGVFIGGNTPGAALRAEYVTIQSAGNSQDFGDLNHISTTHLAQPIGMSDSHGGLGGF